MENPKMNDFNILNESSKKVCSAFIKCSLIFIIGRMRMDINTSKPEFVLNQLNLVKKFSDFATRLEIKMSRELKSRLIEK